MGARRRMPLREIALGSLTRLGNYEHDTLSLTIWTLRLARAVLSIEGVERILEGVGARRANSCRAIDRDRWTR